MIWFKKRRFCKAHNLTFYKVTNYLRKLVLSIRDPGTFLITSRSYLDCIAYCLHHIFLPLVFPVFAMSADNFFSEFRVTTVPDDEATSSLVSGTYSTPHGGDDGGLLICLGLPGRIMKVRNVV